MESVRSALTHKSIPTRGGTPDAPEERELQRHSLGQQLGPLVRDGEELVPVRDRRIARDGDRLEVLERHPDVNLNRQKGFARRRECV